MAQEAYQISDEAHINHRPCKLRLESLGCLITKWSTCKFNSVSRCISARATSSPSHPVLVSLSYHQLRMQRHY
jgi:hypothetical protein